MNKMLAPLLFNAALLMHDASAQQIKVANIKKPHSHHSEHLGSVLMFGDDHLEVVGDKKTSTITFFATNKMRESLPIEQLNLSVNLQSGGKIQPLTITPANRLSNQATLTITKEQLLDGVLKIRLTRKIPPAGHIQAKLELPLPLAKVIQ